MIDRRTLLGTGLAAAGVAALPRSASAHVIVPPFKLYDTHAHFYTNDVDKYPFNARTSRYGPEIMVAKAMRFPQTPKEVFAFWDESGIAKGARASSTRAPTASITPTCSTSPPSIPTGSCPS